MHMDLPILSTIYLHEKCLYPKIIPITRTTKNVKRTLINGSNLIPFVKTARYYITHLKITTLHSTNLLVNLLADHTKIMSVSYSQKIKRKKKKL